MTGPQKALMVCNSVAGSVKEAVASTVAGMKKNGFTCHATPALSGVTPYWCEDAKKNTIIFGVSMEEKSCLLSFLDILKMSVETGHSLPTFPGCQE